MNIDLEDIKEKTQKCHNYITKKKQELRKLNHFLSKEEAIEIPPGLAESLSNKLEQYENKHSYNNIIHH